jgi:hypothetical protein
VESIGWSWATSKKDKLAKLLIHTISIEMNLICTDLLRVLDPSSRKSTSSAAADLPSRSHQTLLSCCSQLKKAVDFLSHQAELLEINESKLQIAPEEIEAQFKTLSSCIGYVIDILKELSEVDTGVAGSWIESVAVLLDLLVHWTLEGGPLNDDWISAIASTKCLQVLMGLVEKDQRLAQFVWPLLIVSPNLRERIYDHTELIIPALLQQLAVFAKTKNSILDPSTGSVRDLPMIIAEILEEMIQPASEDHPIAAIEPERILAAFHRNDEHVANTIQCLDFVRSSKKSTKMAAVDSDRAVLFVERLIFILLNLLEAAKSSLKKELVEKSLLVISEHLKSQASLLKTEYCQRLRDRNLEKSSSLLPDLKK